MLSQATQLVKLGAVMHKALGCRGMVRRPRPKNSVYTGSTIIFQVELPLIDEDGQEFPPVSSMGLLVLADGCVV